MKTYIKKAGYKFVADYNDLIDKQFTLLSVVYDQSASSVLKDIVLDRVETYKLFLKDLDIVLLKTKLESIINTALTAGINISEYAAIEADKVENGYEITLQFTIRG